MSRESSYDYTAEQSHYEELLNKARNQRASREPTPDHSLENNTSRGAVKRHKPRVSRDAQAYKPGQDEDEDEDYESDDGRKGRRKKKKDESAGRLTNLPTVGYSKKRKGTRKSRGGPETIDEEPENDESTSFNETGGYVDDSAVSSSSLGYL
jgi:SUN domain-containing protein 1/2